MGKKLFTIALCLFISIGAALAQTIKVSGTVIDTEGHPVVGATVIISGTTTGVSTDTEGRYNISAPVNGKFLVSCLGYDDVVVDIAKRSVVDITLTESTAALDEVTVVAYGTKRKQDLVGSVSSVKKDIISNAQTASISSALEGSVAGLQIISSSGQPGDDASIVIRGTGSISANNSALIVVDGVPYNGSISDINPADIESISVSKDAVSNSLYGSRAAGGVVMITTKSGKGGKFNVQFTGTWGMSQRAYKDYDMATDPGEFYRLTWYGLRNTYWAAGNSLEDSAAGASANLLDNLGNYNAFIIPDGEYLVTPDGALNANAKVRYNDTFADAMFKSSFRQEYNVSASGGNDKTNYYMSIGYLDNDSYIVGSSYDRLTARVNVDSQVKKWLRVGTNIGYAKTTKRGVNETTGKASNPFETARSWAPIFPVHAYDAEGNVKLDSSGNPIYDAGTGQTDGTKTRPVATNQNIIVNLNEDIKKSEYNNLTSRSFIEFKFLDCLTFTANYAYDFSNGSGTVYYTPTIGDGKSFGGRGTKSASTVATTDLNQILRYSDSFGKHNIEAKIGHDHQSMKLSYLAGQKTNFLDPWNPELNNGGEMQYISSYTASHEIEGFFGTADYDYAHKYYLSAAYRRDGTSRFLKRWGNFWTVGAAWRISAESFMSGASNWLNDLKLRASYGTQGNEDILVGDDSYSAYTPYVDQYTVSWTGSELAYTPSFFGNPDLTWEKQKTVDVGLDFRFLDRIYGSVEYFYRKTDDMLFKRPLPESTAGRPYNWENIGAMANNGVEFEVNVDILKKHDLRWTVGVVGSHYSNKILTLPEENKADGITSGNFKLMEGKSLYEYYTYMYAGMDEKGNAMWYANELDAEGNPTGNKTTTTKYTDADKYYIGKSAIPAINGGLNTNFYFKGFDLSIATAFQLGGWAYDYSFLSGMNSSFYVGHNRAMWNTFNPETGTGEYPIWNANNSSNSFTQTSDMHLVKASYFSIRNLTLGYTLPKKLTDKVQIEKIRVFFTADNLALWSARQGFDPRVSMNGSNGSYGGYSPMRVLTGGVNLVF